MHRFFIAPQDIDGHQALLDENESRHALQVMRLKAGQEVVLFDGQGRSYQAMLEGTQGRRVQALLLQVLEDTPAAAIDIHLVQGLPKGDKLDTIIQKAVELGVHSLYPLQCKRSVAQLKASLLDKKMQRWDAIVRDACKQSGRNRLLHVQPVRDVTQVLQFMQAAPGIVLYEKEKQAGYRELLHRLIPGCINRELYIMVGPEGGWDDSEIDELTAAGVLTASLGRGILRTETAAVVAAALALYEAGELG